MVELERFCCPEAKRSADIVEMDRLQLLKEGCLGEGVVGNDEKVTLLVVMWTREHRDKVLARRDDRRQVDSAAQGG